MPTIKLRLHSHLLELDTAKMQKNLQFTKRKSIFFLYFWIILEFISAAKMRKNILYLSILLLSGKVWSQSCPEIEKLFRVKDTTILYSDKVVRFVIPNEKFNTLPQDSLTKKIGDAVFVGQQFIYETTNFLRAKEFEQAGLCIDKAKQQIRYAQSLCPVLKFTLWKRELNFYESAIGLIRVARAMKEPVSDYKSSLAKKLESEGYKVVVDSAGVHAEKVAKNNSTDYIYGDSYIKSTQFGLSGLDSYSSSSRPTYKKARTQHVSAYTRRSKSGKTTYVRSYYRSPGNSGSSRSYRSRRHR